MLASKDLNAELEIMEQSIDNAENSFSDYEKLQIKCSILLLRLMRDIRSNQVLDLKSRGVVLRESTPGKQGGGGHETKAPTATRN